MKQQCLVVTLVLSLMGSAFAARGEKEANRVKDAGEVLKEILNIPDNIPKDLFNKAECVVVLPSVKKLAIGIGGSYGRGAMSCRRVEPSSDMPANNPRDREYERISARRATSLAAVASRPFGPAAAAASAPNFTFVFNSDSAPRGFITSNTKSVAWPPS